MTTNNTIIPEGTFHGLQVSDQGVQSIAKALRINPDRLIARIEAALPAQAEQELYVKIGSDFKIQPESLAKLLREFLGPREVVATDSVAHAVGKNLIAYPFGDVNDFLTGVFDLLGMDLDINVSMRNAAKLVIAYGHGTEAVVDDLFANVEMVAKRLGLKGKDGKIVGIGIAFLVETAIPKRLKEGRPIPRTLSEYFESE